MTPALCASRLAAVAEAQPREQAFPPAEDCGGIPNPGPGCLGASSDPFGVSNKAAKGRGRGRREARCQCRPGQLGKH